ncbi:GNAT family N-acetyltransferase [Actinoplanes campanulatus]|uniref:GNAT family N-acetyltransferase n=1 Tax=Actinoplanes campanulatus TaxID=113559 RepID=UPI001EF37449|nr:GNAT family N-acetyltransferase [Actinoplanes capillaceus]
MGSEIAPTGRNGPDEAGRRHAYRERALSETSATALSGLRRVIVRKGNVADAPALAELRDIGPDGIAAFTGWMATHAETHLPFVAEIDGYVVGCAWLFVAQRVPGSQAMDRRFGDVQSVMVREEFRRQGIGAALMAAILAEARDRGLLHVTVHSGRRAVDFYRCNGFTHHRQILIWESTPPDARMGHA